ncbi:MAG: UDP-glucuronic acid decarboxylase family protein, partial [Planctomycetota bacterium]
MELKTLVTGGAGFIGSHLCHTLLEQGAEVYCVDNFLTGSKRNIEPLRSHPKFHFIHHDIIEPYFPEWLDRIYNLACPASPPAYQYNAIRTIKANTIGMINVLGMARRLKARILQASTSEVYGDPKINPQSEHYWGNVNCTGIRSCYDEGKRVAETLCFDYHRSHQVDIRVVRIFNTYGPHMDPNDGRVVSNFIVQALKGEDITIYGNGQQTRSFCYVEDLVPGLLKMMEQPSEIGPINLGNDQEFTILELAEKVLKLTKSKSKLVFRPLPGDDPTQRRPDLNRARKLFNWAPRFTLEQGLVPTI